MAAGCDCRRAKLSRRERSLDAEHPSKAAVVFRLEMVEPAGAASLAGACQNPDAIRDKRVVFILTGANISAELLRRALDTKPLV